RYLTDVFSDYAVDYLRQRSRLSQPFFLHLAYNAPHFPLQAPEKYIQKHRRDRRTEAVARIYAMNEVMDNGIGRLLEALDELALSENTLVVFTSDNGPDLSGTGESSTHRYNCGLNGSKQHVYEGGIK